MRALTDQELGGLHTCRATAHDALHVRLAVTSAEQRLLDQRKSFGLDLTVHSRRKAGAKITSAARSRASAQAEPEIILALNLRPANFRPSAPTWYRRGE